MSTAPGHVAGLLPENPGWAGGSGKELFQGHDGPDDGECVKKKGAPQHGLEARSHPDFQVCQVLLCGNVALGGADRLGDGFRRLPLHMPDASRSRAVASVSNAWAMSPYGATFRAGINPGGAACVYVSGQTNSRGRRRTRPATSGQCGRGAFPGLYGAIPPFRVGFKRPGPEKRLRGRRERLGADPGLPLAPGTGKSREGPSGGRSGPWRRFPGPGLAWGLPARRKGPAATRARSRAAWRPAPGGAKFSGHGPPRRAGHEGRENEPRRVQGRGHTQEQSCIAGRMVPRGAGRRSRKKTRRPRGWTLPGFSKRYQKRRRAGRNLPRFPEGIR